MNYSVGVEALSAPRILADTVTTSSIFEGGTSPLALARRAPIRQEMKTLPQELRCGPAPLPTEAKQSAHTIPRQANLREASALSRILHTQRSNGMAGRLKAKQQWKEDAATELRGTPSLQRRAPSSAIHKWTRNHERSE